MAWVGAAIGGVGQIAGAVAASKAAKKADQRLQEGRDYAINQSGLGQYRDTGVAANQQQQALLGLPGTDPTQAQAGFNNYLNSSGYQANLQGGTDALNSNAAARGLLKSGATLKATQKFGADLGSSYFNSYLGQVSDVAGRGMQAADSLARTVTGTAGSMANNALGVGDAQANAYGTIGKTVGAGVNYALGQNAPPAPGSNSIWG